MIDPYQSLANAIVIQAAKDYRRALRKLKKYPNNTDAKRTVADCERFFHSDWYEILTNVKAEYLIRKLREEVENE